MAGYPPPFPPPGPPNRQDWKFQRRILRDQDRARRDQYRYQMRGMRRGSLLGPVLIVLIGVIFLLVQTGRLHSDRIWGWYGHWWPLLLVVAGIVLLAEWAIDQARPRDPQVPYVRRSIGGGVIFLIILLALIGASFEGIRDGRDFIGHKFSINPDDFEQFLGDKHESDETLVEPLTAGSALHLDNPRGDVSVTGTSTDGQVHLGIHKQVYSRSDSDAQDKSRQLSPTIGNSSKLLTLTFPNLTGAQADITMTLPEGAALTVNANHGDVQVDSIKAPVNIIANHGDVSIGSVAGPVDARVNHNGSSFSAHNIHGPVTVEGHASDLTISEIDGPISMTGEFFGTTHVEHIRGPVRFHTSRTDFQLVRLDGEMEISPDADLSADQALGPVILSTRNRNITLERISGDLSVTNRNGTVDLTSAPPVGNVTVQNRNGTVNLTLPDHTNFAVNAETTDGSIENDFSLPNVDHEQKATMSGIVGKGGPTIHIISSQGDVSLKKASIAPLPKSSAPLPPLPPVPATPQVSINGEDGSSVYVGKDGVRILSGADGSSVIIGKDGLKITASADGSSDYKGKDGTQLTTRADGSKIFIGRDGTRFTQSADGSKLLRDRDGTKITLAADGTRIAKSPGGKTLNDQEINDRIRRAEDEVRNAEQQRDTEQREERSHKEQP